MLEVDMKLWAIKHWLFKYLSGTQNSKFWSVSKWLRRNYHQISLEYGDVEYEELDRISNLLIFDRIYIKGKQKYG